MKGIFCPECGHPLKLGAHLHQDQRIICTHCETKLTIVNLDPIEVDVMLETNSSSDTKKKGQTVQVPCPECDNPIKVSAHARRGQRIQCDDCHAILEVVNADPLELDVAVLTKFRHNRR